MNMLDCILEPSDPAYQELVAVDGPLLADEYMRAFNNACVQYAGFEQFFMQKPPTIRPHVAWINNLSVMEH